MLLFRNFLTIIYLESEVKSMKVGSKLKMIRLIRNLTLDEVAKAMNEIVPESEGISYNKGKISKWENDTAEPNLYALKYLLDFYQVSFDDVINNKFTIDSLNGKQIPIIGTIAAGTPLLAEENIEDYFCIDNSVECDFGLRVKGDSMINADIFDGDIVFIRKQPDLENGEIGAILLDNEATLKRFSKTDSSVVLQAENPSMTDWPRVYTDGNIRVLGKLVGVYSKKD